MDQRTIMVLLFESGQTWIELFVDLPLIHDQNSTQIITREISINKHSEYENFQNETKIH